MNKSNVWRQLNAAQVALIVLLIIGASLTFWIEHTRAAAGDRSDHLARNSERIRSDFAVMSESVRGVLLNTRNENERVRRETAAKDLADTFAELQKEYGSQPELAAALKTLRDHATRHLIPFHAQILEQAKTNLAGATESYLKDYGAIRKQRDDLFADFHKQVSKFSEADSRQAQNISQAGIVAILLVFLTAVIVGRFQHTSVSAPLGQLTAALDRLRRGDFTHRITMQRKDEFGVLAENLNQLAGDLSALVGQVQRSGIQVNTTTTEIAATAREQQSTANQIAATTAEIGATSKEISATSKELDKTMNEVSQVAEDTAQLANSGQTGIGRMEGTMRQIMDASGAITAKLAVLSEKTANINSVVTTITKVADQTNLLSLNAAIEAEKAGEYGLGFAVVAMEIRRLADQTAVATYDIEKMVKEMQSAVSAGVMGMDKFSEEVRRGVDEIRNVSTQLAQIIHQVQTLTPRFQTVNEGMHAQATGAQQISETLTQLSEAAQQTAESLRQSNLAIEQLNDAARGLQTSVSRFKLEA
ncbi:MAG: methyl-accepting chemotaxis protein [Pedosphaera sp.]|nr:methyl-accepting chemotaxis protein [Pedosphaera sp.]